jgi:hypothetical protein
VKYQWARKSVDKSSSIWENQPFTYWAWIVKYQWVRKSVDKLSSIWENQPFTYWAWIVKYQWVRKSVDKLSSIWENQPFTYWAWIVKYQWVRKSVDKLSAIWENQSLFLLFNYYAACFRRSSQHRFIIFGFIQLEIQTMSICICDEHANHYITEAI